MSEPASTILGKVLQALELFEKVPWKGAVIVAAGTGVLLFAPKEASAALGIGDLGDWRWLAGVPFVFCCFVLVMAVALKAVQAVERNRARKRRLQRLHRLDGGERMLLTSFLVFGHRSSAYLASEGFEVSDYLRAQSMAGAGIVEMVNPVTFEIQEWAWVYLNEHPELVLDGPNLEHFRRRRAEKRRQRG